MSLFTAALGGAGAAAQDMAGVWVREESQANLQNNQGRIQAELQNSAAELDKGKARLINELTVGRDAIQHKQRMEADAAQTAGQVAGRRQTFIDEVSPEVTAGRAAQQGAIEKSKSEENIYQMPPGAQLQTGKGVIVGGNGRQTPQEAMKDEYDSGQRGAASRGPKAIDPAKRSDFDKMFTPALFKDDNGVVDHARMMEHKEIATARFEQDPNHDATRSFAMAGALIEKAKAVAAAQLGKDDAKDPAKFKKAYEAVVDDMRKQLGIPPGERFNKPAETAAAPADDGEVRRAAERAANQARAKAESDKIQSYGRMSAAELRAAADADRIATEDKKFAPQRPNLFSQAKDADFGRTTEQTPSLAEIARMTPTEAGAARTKYWSQLSDEQKRALNRRM